MKAAWRRAGMFTIERDSVPTETLQIWSIKSVRLSGDRSGEPRSESGPRRTWLNVVTAWSSAFEPHFWGRGRDVTPGAICVSSQSETMKGFTPQSTSFARSLAKTMPTRGIPAQGVVGGMILAAPGLGVCSLNDPSGWSVAVVSRFFASRPWLISVRRYSPHMLKLSRSRSSLVSCGLCRANLPMVPIHKFQCILKIVVTLISLADITSMR